MTQSFLNFERFVIRSEKRIMNLKLFSLLTVITTAFITNVSAVSSSTMQLAQSLTPDSVINTTVYNLTTTKSNSVTRPDTSVISGYTALPNTITDTDNGRKMIVTLMEEDQYPNEDDKVKAYTWTSLEIQLLQLADFFSTVYLITEEQKLCRH